MASAESAVGWYRPVFARRCSRPPDAAPLGRSTRRGNAPVGGAGQCEPTVMRHSGPPFSVPGLPDRMQALSPLAGLIALSRAPDAAATGARGATRAAVAPASVAASTRREEPGTRPERADRPPVTLGPHLPGRTGGQGTNDRALWDRMEDGQVHRAPRSGGPSSVNGERR